jgi:integrase
LDPLIKSKFLIPDLNRQRTSRGDADPTILTRLRPESVRPSDMKCHEATRRVVWRGPLGVRGPAADPSKGGDMKLTELKIERLKVEQGRKDRLVFDDAQRGLAVRVTASGGRTYLCQYTLHGQKWRFPLGACSALSLANAREAAAVVMGDVAKGRNPVADRKAEAAAARAKRARDRLTLRALIEDWNRLHLAERRPRYATEAVRALHYAFADALDDPAEGLERAAVVRSLDALARRRARRDWTASRPKGTAMTGRTAAYGRAAFGWAIKRGMVHTNPFAALPVSKGIAKRERVLTDDEIREIWQASGEAAAPYGSIVQMLILTGQRRGEVAGMTWREISEDLSTWTMPGERTKNGVPHVVPLSGAARDLLRGLLPEGAAEATCAMAERRARGTLVLPGLLGTPFAGWSKAKIALDKAIVDARTEAIPAGTSRTPIVPWSVHDLRRTFATGLQRLGIRLEVTEAVLNHISGSRAGIAGVYQRHDWAAEKRAALDAWAAHVLAVVEGRMAAPNVVALVRAV